MTRGARRGFEGETTRSAPAPFLAGPADEMRLSRLQFGDSEYVVFSAPVPAEPVVRLTEAERAVYASLLAGLGNAEIARERGVSPRTVAHQTASIFQKFGVGSRAELSARALTTSGLRWAGTRKR